jgi:hypothetical protein
MEGSTMIEDQPIPASIPFLRTNEEQAVKVRKRLEDIFSNISLVHDVIVMSIEVCESNSGDFNPEMSHVLRRCGANKLHSQLKALTSIIEKFGGKTEFSKTNNLGICAEVSNDPS